MSFEYPLILDGGFATELERSFGKDLSGKLWSAQCLKDDPDAIKAVHTMYYEAGANIATTCSYQASLEGFAEAGYSPEESIELMKKSVSLACEARDEYKKNHTDDAADRLERLVALSIGPYGAILANGAEYTGDYGKEIELEDLVEFHRKRLGIFLSSRNKVDLVLFETIPSYLEAQAIAKVVMDWDDTLPPVAVSFQCKSSNQIADGTEIQKACGVFNHLEKVFATGFNCTKPKFLEELLKTVYEVNQKHNKVLVVYPDGGAEWDAVKRSWDEKVKLQEEGFGSIMAKSVLDYGPRMIVGGCCGTGPSHIKSIRSFLEK